MSLFFSSAAVGSPSIGSDVVRSVQGVNVLETGTAPRVIKTWEDRLLEEGVESGVDDEVCLPFTTLSLN